MSFIQNKMLFRCLMSLAVLCAVRAETCSQTNNCTCTTRRATCVGGGINTQALGIRADFADYNFTKNDLGALGGNSFEALNHVSYLFLRYNKITQLDSATFELSAGLIHLDLAYNKISELPPTLFSKNKFLSEFDCAFNNLTRIGRQLFGGLSQLKYVNLVGNQLTKIDAHAFSSNPSLYRLFLEDNKLQTAYWRWISHFNHSEPESYELYLDGNPWSCDCRMIQFVDGVMRNRWITAHTHGSPSCVSGSPCHISTPTCASASDQGLIGKLLINIPEKQLFCKKPTVTSANDCSLSNCNVTFDERSTGIVHCSGDGLPIPTVQILDESNRPMTEKRQGAVNMTFAPVTIDDAGMYYCVIIGLNSSNSVSTSSITVKSVINVVVKPKPSSTLGIVLALLAIGLIVVVVVVYLRHRSRSCDGYGSLSNENDSPVRYLEEDDSLTNPQQSQYTDAIEEYGGAQHAPEHMVDDDKEVLV